MQTYQHLLSELKHSPQLPAAIEELNAYWKDEQQRRVKFYDDLDEDMKAEFIDGEVVMHSPVREAHNESRTLMERLIGTYVDVHDLGIVRSEKALIVLARNDFEPDVAFWGLAKSKGIKPQTMKYPAPDWVCEILSPSTVKNDRVVKMADYAANGIAEYWIIDADRRVAEIYLLQDVGQYELQVKTDSGLLRCQTIAGLQFPIEAIFDREANLLALQNILIKD
jgi:Uma2 family endonuclease